MVSSVSSITSFTPSSYLTELKSGSKLGVVANVLPVTPATPTKPATTGSTTDTSNSLGSASNNLLGLSSGVLSVLQGTSSSSSNNILASLLGNSSNPDITSSLLGSSSNSVADSVGSLLGGSSGVLTGLLSQASGISPTTQALQAFASQQANSAAGKSTVQSLINSYHAVQNSNTANLLQNSKSVLAQNGGLVA